MFWHDKDSSVKTFSYLDKRRNFLKKLNHHMSSRIPYFVSLTIFLLPNRHKVFERKHSNNFHVKLSGVVFLPWSLGFFICVFSWLGCFFFFLFFIHSFVVVVFNSGISERMSDRKKALYMFWPFTNSVEILHRVWGQVVNRIMSWVFYVNTYLSSLHCCFL